MKVKFKKGMRRWWKRGCERGDVKEIEGKGWR